MNQNLTTEDLQIRLLIVDDEQTIRRLCITVGESLGFFCLEAESGNAALALLEEQSVHMVLTDMVMPRMTGLEFLEQVKRTYPRIEVAVMTGHGSVETAVQAMKLGAYDYIAKPFSPLDELRLFLRRMADKVRLVEENLYLRERSETETSLHGIIGNSTGIQNVLRMISRLKDTRTPVLISGESGTGKELVARALHFRGTMASRPFVAVDCGSLVPTLIESELFGYEKGAFTGALRSKQGLLQSADTGTIFFDEVGELPLEMQAKLSVSYTHLDVYKRQKLIHAEKMAAVGHLVSGVAHEVNNPLTAILGFTDLLMENPEIPESARRDLRVILQEAQRTKQIVQNLLSFARQNPPQRQPVHLNNIVQRTVHLRSYDFISHGIQVIEHLDESLPQVVGDSHQLQQVFLNILNNAYDAVRETARPARIEIMSALAGPFVEISFRDNGTGIADPEHIFDPFVTTKDVGQGTGLGLSICYGIVREHCGEILGHNNLDSEGATFIVRLPVTSETASFGAAAGVHPK